MQQREFSKRSAVVLCLLLSALLHWLLALLLLQIPGSPRPRSTEPTTVRTVRLLRPHVAEQNEAQPADSPRDKPFAKTNPDVQEQRPEQVDFIGKRNAKAASDIEARQLEGDNPAPALSGEQKDEIVTFDQKHQQGDLAHDGKEDADPAPPSLPPPPAPSPAPASSGALAVSQPQTAQDAGLALASEQAQDAAPDTPPQDLPRPTIEQPISPPTPVALPAAPRFYRDPSLADSAPPGFRTRERRSRSSGRFVLGKHPALNVAATPKGHYEEEVYRRIAYWWYQACDDHRGDIIPGKIVVSLRLNNRGQLVNMDLVQRSGAGVIQQSFTFGAIRKASLPPMPPAVQEEIVGDLLELIFEFVFN